MNQDANRAYFPREPRPIALWLFVGFFWFGAAMCSLTLFLVFVPGTALDAAWRIKPQARDELAALGLLTLPLMLIVGIACALVAVGLEKSNEWGRRTAIAVLTVDMLGDSINAVFRGDWRTLIRLPIAALMITYLIRTRRSFT